jgi:hypothetical protein
MEQELNQEGVVEEQATEKPSEPVSPPTSTEEKTTSERTYSESEWRKMQSMKDQEAAKAQRLARENEQLRQLQEQQRLAARQKEIAELEGDPDGQAKARKAHQLEDELVRLESEREKQEGAVARKYDQAMELASQYNLSLADARELMKAETPREMELQAQLKVAEKGKSVSPPEDKGVEVPTPDSNTSDAAPSDFKQLRKNFINDPWKYGKQYKEALAKRGQ